MRNLLYFSSILLTCLMGCGGPHYVDYFPYHDDGTVKPKVAFLPVKALESKSQDVAAYFDEAIRFGAMDHGQLYLYSKGEIAECLQKNSEVFKGKDVLKAANCFQPGDFVVEVEVIQDEIVPYNSGLVNCFIPPVSSRCQNARLVKLRLKVIDIRCNAPRVILFEILERSQMLPVCDERPYITKSVYERLSEDTVVRIQEVIESAR